MFFNMKVTHYDPTDFPPNRGGDYLIYSDVKQEDIDPPIVFYCPSGALQP